MQNVTYRQVHLDFHTSEYITNIGSKFEKKQFQKMLKTVNVDSVTLFSKCHHGFNYHPTKIGKMHPNLSFNLLKEQIEACKEINVRTPVYISAGYDEFYIQNNPGVIAITKSGLDPLMIGFKRICLNSTYLNYLSKGYWTVIRKLC